MMKPNDLQNCVSYKPHDDGLGIDFLVGPREYQVRLSEDSQELVRQTPSLLPEATEDLYGRLRKEATQAAIGMVSLGDPLGPQELGEGWSQLELWPAQVDLIRKAAVFAGTIPSLKTTQLAKALGVTRQAIQSRLRAGTLQAYTSHATKLIPLDQLQADEQEKAKAFLKEASSARD